MTTRLIDGKAQSSRFVGPRAYHHYLRSQIQLHRGDRAAAIHQLQMALAFDPTSPYLHTELGRVLALVDRKREALSHVAEALRHREGFADALLLKATLQRDKPAAAARTLRQCIAANPDQPIGYVRLAELLQRRGRFGPARQLLQQMVQRLPAVRSGWASLGTLCLRTVDYRCARKAFARALQLQTKVETLTRQGHVLRALGDASASERLLREAFDRSGGHPSVALELASLLAQRGKQRSVDDLLEIMEREADERPDRLARTAMVGLRGGRAAQVLALVDRHLRPAVSSKPEVAPLLLAKASALIELKRFAEAEALLARVRGPARVAAEIERAALSRKRADGVQASTILKRALEQLGHHDELVVALLDALYREGKATQAVTVARKAFAKQGGYRLHFALAAALDRAGRHQQAIAEMRRLGRSRPQDPAVHNFIGYVQAEQRIDLAAAERSVRRALMLGPGRPHIIDSLGWVAYRRGRLAEADHLLTLAIRLSPEEPEVLAHRAEVLVALKRWSAALGLFRRALALCDDQRLAIKLRASIKKLSQQRVGRRNQPEER